MKQLKNFLIKREQSQARLSFAKREKSRLLAKTIMTLALLLTAATGAWAQEEVLLTTITPTSMTTYDETTPGVVTVVISGIDSYNAYYGWKRVDEGTATITVTAAEGYTITRCVFKQFPSEYPNRVLEDDKTPFVMTINGAGMGDASCFIEASDGQRNSPAGMDGASVIEVYGTAASSGTAVPLTQGTGEKINEWTLTNGMPAGNVTVSVDYYPQATMAEGAVTAATDVAATTDAPLVTVDATKLTGVAKMMYYVSTEATAPAYDAEGWTDVLPTAKDYTEAANLNVWYYPVGTDEGVGGATATYSDGDMNTTALTVTLGAAPTYNVEFAEGIEESDKWTADPNTGVTKGQTVTVTYTGERRVKGVKAVKKAAASGTPLDNATTAWTAGTYAVPAGGLTYSAAITVSGDVTLVLTDGETLTLNKGISLASGATLTVQGNGTMNVNGTNGADINTQVMDASADSGTEAISGSGTVVLTSGTLTATGGKGGNVNDYYPECKGGHGAAGISCTLIVNGGTVTATGGNGGSLTGGNSGPMGVAGNGGAGISGALTVNGGTLTATGGDGGAKSTGEDAQAGTNGRGISSTWTAGTGITFSDSANGTTWTANSGTSSTQKYVKAE